MYIWQSGQLGPEPAEGAHPATGMAGAGAEGAKGVFRA